MVGISSRNAEPSIEIRLHRTVDRYSGQIQPTGGLGGLNGDGGQNSFERSNGGRIGGGDPLDQFHLGQAGSVAPFGDGTYVLIAGCGCTCGISGGADGRSTEPGGAGSEGSAIETETRMVEPPWRLLIMPVTAKIKESLPTAFSLAL